MKKYEALFIFSNSLKDENVESALKDIEAEVTKLHGTVKGTQRLGVRSFPRPMKKLEAGHYVRLALELEPADVAPLQTRLKLNENIFRVQIIRTIERKKREERVAAKKKEGVANGQS